MIHKCLFIIEKDNVKVYRKNENSKVLENICFKGESKFPLAYKNVDELWRWIGNTLIESNKDQFDMCFLFEDQYTEIECPYVQVEKSSWTTKKVLSALSELYKNTNIILQNENKEVINKIYGIIGENP